MTAVEWLLENLMSEPYSEEDFKYNEECWDRAELMEKEQRHESIDKQVKILKDTLEEMMTGFDSEEDRMDFILDICNGYKKRIKSKQDEDRSGRL
jgi:hypothetical protein